MKRKVVGIVIFPEVEVLDFCGPYEVFSVVRLDEERRREEPSPFQVLLVAEQAEAVTTAGGLRVLPDCTLAACPRLDILVVPGGWGTRRQIENETLIDWIAQRGRQVETLTSVCTGALLLGRAGLLDGRRATTHWRSLAWLRESFPAVTVEDKLARGRRWPYPHVGGHRRGDRSGSKGGGPLLWRGRGPGHGAADGVSLSGG